MDLLGELDLQTPYRAVCSGATTNTEAEFSRKVCASKVNFLERFSNLWKEVLNFSQLGCSFRRVLTLRRNGSDNIANLSFGRLAFYELTAPLRQLLLILGALVFSFSGAAQPGTVLLSDDFDNGAIACGTLAPNWTTSDPNLGEIGTFTANSNSCSLFTRGGAVDVTSIAADASAAIGVDLTAWVQKGDDAFSEDPDSAAEDLVLEYLTVGGLWVPLQSFSAAALPDGAVTLVNISLPLTALHSGLQIRFRQLGGSGGPPANGGTGFDFWHIDDVVLIETGLPPPLPTLTANSCDDFENGLSNWSVTDFSRSNINGDTFNSASNSLFLRHGDVTTTSVAVSTPSLEQVTIFVQRGDDAFSENPEAGEDLIFEFLDDTGTFVVLETFPGGGPQGEIFNRTFTMPASARHAGFRLQFRYGSASGSDFDYWHIDDVCLISGVPDLVAAKSVTIEDAAGAAPGETFAVPGVFARYRIDVTNNGIGVVDAGSLDISDIIDPNTIMFVGDLDGAGSPFIFTDGTGAAASGITLDFIGLASGGDGIEFLDGGGTSIVPTPDFDANVASFALNFQGAMLGAVGGTSTTFSIEYRVRLE